MEEDIELEIPDVRPDWFMPVALVLDTASEVVGAVSTGLMAMSNLMGTYSAHYHGKRVFHEEATMAIETIAGEPDAEGR